MQGQATAAELPLQGVRILDLARLIAGGYLTTVLADYGAEVVKVEQRGRGDPLRAWSSREGAELWWKVYARNKKSLTLNLGAEEGRAVLLRLVEHFDVLVEAFVPGKLESWGLQPEALLERNPRLIVVRVSGWGQTGAYAHRPGFGTLIEAMSGFAHMTGFPDQPPTLPPLPLADMTTALYGAAATMTALYHRDLRGGRGQVIDLSIYEPLLSILGPLAAEHQHFGIVPERRGNRAPTNAPRNTYQCSDGKWLALSAATQAMAERTLRAIGRADLIDDPRFRTNTDRVRNVDALDAAMQEVIGARTLAENLASFHELRVTAAPVYDISQIASDEHVRTREALVAQEDPDWGSVMMHNVIPRFSETPGRIRHTGRAVGADNRDVLAAAGFSADEIADLERRSVI
jgi:crotonobetainyl-CoA:carnitine CoA-transferase CaiB-like acyl-CoA transferase